MDVLKRAAPRRPPVARRDVGEVPDETPESPIGWTLSVVLAVTLPLLALALTTVGLARRPDVGWRGVYTHPGMVGAPAPMLRVDRELRFDWGYGGPGSGIPPDGFSASWVSCLTLPEDEAIGFRLGSDDGSRLFLDGRLLVDNWRDQDLHWESRTVKLSAGSHPVRVDYYESRGRARVTLELMREGGRGGPVDPAWLRPPTDSATACERR